MKKIKNAIDKRTDVRYNADMQTNVQSNVLLIVTKIQINNLQGGVLMKKLLMMAIILGLLGVILIFHLDAAEVEANDSLRVNERKYFTGYVVEKDDTLWDIAERFSTPEYASNHCYIKEVMETNHLEHLEIKEGQLLVLPYYADEPVSGF